MLSSSVGMNEGHFTPGLVSPLSTLMHMLGFTTSHCRCHCTPIVTIYNEDYWDPTELCSTIKYVKLILRKGATTSLPPSNVMQFLYKTRLKFVHPLPLARNIKIA